ncbi:PGPGW domain-containing protein [Kitasatospora sp. NPDC004531]
MNDQQRPDYEADPGSLHPVARVVLGTVGVVLITVGVVLLVLPGPGMLLLLAGLVLLARAVPSFSRFVEPVRLKAMEGAEASVASRWRIAGSVLAGLGLIGGGIIAILAPNLPLAGWPTGLSLILSGLILFALLIWSHRRVHGHR